MRLTLITALITLVVDQLTKLLVVHGLNLRARGEIDVFPPYLNFRMAWNYGINFGLFAGGPEVTRYGLIVLALVICIWMIWWARTGLTRPIALLSAGAVVGGALGNSLDRLIHGAVIDFLNMSCCGIDNPFAFNIADIGVFGGAIGLLIFADSRHKTE